MKRTNKRIRNKGREIWYKSFKTRITKVEKDYEFPKMIMRKNN